MPLQDAREQVLLRRVRIGDREALQDLLLETQPRLLAICRRMSANEHIAADLCQETMVRIIQGLPSFESRSKVSTWMIRIAMNVCLTHSRKASIRRASRFDENRGSNGRLGSESAFGGQEFSVSSGELSPLERIESREEAAQVLDAFSLLEPEHQAVLLLRDGHDFDYAAIAEILGKPVGTIKSRLFRARAALRDVTNRLGTRSGRNG